MRDVKVPTQTTLNKYGLSQAEWIDMFMAQDGKCPICHKEPKTFKGGEFHIDHWHVRNWKNMLPEERKRFVRGIVCQWCNRSYLSKGINLTKARNMVIYLEKFKPLEQS